MMEKRDTSMGVETDATLARAVHRAKIELEQMIDLAPQVMLLVDEAGCITRANVAALRLLGVAEFGSVLGRKIEDCFSVQAEGFFRELLGTGVGCATRDVPASAKSGRAGIFRFTVVGIGGASLTRVLIVEDVTAQKEQAVRDEKEHKKDAVRALAGALMHRINQRLTVITVRSKLMLMALEKGDVQGDELKVGLQDIMSLTMEVAGILDQLGDQKDFITESYLDGMEILDLERSSGRKGTL